jgi:hypothetical protein
MNTRAKRILLFVAMSCLVSAIKADIIIKEDGQEVNAPGAANGMVWLCQTALPAKNPFKPCDLSDFVSFDGGKATLFSDKEEGDDGDLSDIAFFQRFMAQEKDGDQFVVEGTDPTKYTPKDGTVPGGVAGKDQPTYDICSDAGGANANAAISCPICGCVTETPESSSLQLFSLALGILLLWISVNRIRVWCRLRSATGILSGT